MALLVVVVIITILVVITTNAEAGHVHPLTRPSIQFGVPSSSATSTAAIIH